MMKRITSLQTRSLAGVLLVISLVVISLVLLAGCSQTTPARGACKVNADCPATNACLQSYCSQGACKTSVKADCCGNSKCDAAENACVCPADCGTCAGTYQLPDARGKLVNATYLEKRCVKSACVYSYSSDVQKEKDFFNQFAGPGFTFNIYVGYLSPFDLSRSTFNITFSLKDYEVDKVKLPVKINEIRIMEGAQLIAQQAPGDLRFSSVGATQAIGVPVRYDATLPEETKSLQVQIDYEYVPLARNSKTGGLDPSPVDRKTYSFPISDKIVVMDPRLAK